MVRGTGRPLRWSTAIATFALALGGCASLLGLSEYEPAGVAADASGSCSLSGMSCGANGRCVEDGTSTHCVCDRGYEGAACGTCASGFVRSDGSCLESCGSGTCPLHATCDASGGTCRCAVGYALESGVCVWRGGPLDHGFTGMPPAWKYPDGGAFDAALDATLTSPGLLFAPMGFVEQDFDMPTVEASEPFALDLALRTACSNCAYAPEFEVGTGRAFTSSPSGPSKTTTSAGIWHQHFCLGDAAYGPGATLSLGGTLETYGFFFDDAAYVPDPACPRPGTARNGDFELPDGWTATAGAAVVPGVGTNGSRAAQLQSGGGSCDLQTITGTVSIPSATTHPALQFSGLGAFGKSLGVLLNGVSVASLVGVGTDNTETVCLRPWTRGLSTSLAFSAGCEPGSYVVDDVRVADNPSCPADALLADGDFETAGRVSVWSVTSDANNGKAEILHSSFDAHAGTGVLKIVGQSLCFPYAQQDVQVPAPSGLAGPAVTLWAKGDANVRLFVDGTAMPLPASGYGPYTVCLPPSRAGRRFPLMIGIRPLDGQVTCAGTAFVDDVVLTTDPTCPAQ